ncbi:hypothetical protein [Streptomyces sp. YGL11-2]
MTGGLALIGRARHPSVVVDAADSAEPRLLAAVAFAGCCFFG